MFPEGVSHAPCGGPMSVKFAKTGTSVALVAVQLSTVAILSAVCLPLGTPRFHPTPAYWAAVAAPGLGEGGQGVKFALGSGTGGEGADNVKTHRFLGGWGEIGGPGLGGRTRPGLFRDRTLSPRGLRRVGAGGKGRTLKHLSDRFNRRFSRKRHRNRRHRSRAGGQLPAVRVTKRSREKNVAQERLSGCRGSG
jgi:hypothetical protein